MGWRFRRSVRIASGVSVNLNKHGGPVSAGWSGAARDPRQRRPAPDIPGPGFSPGHHPGGRSGDGPGGWHALAGAVVVAAALLLLYWLAG